MAIFDEQVLEPFVARGIGNSGVASRQIQATNLPDLSAAVRESTMTQQNLQDQQKSAAKALGLVSASKAMPRISGGASGGAEDLTKPFVVGYRSPSLTSGGGYTVAIPDGKGGFSVKEIYSDRAGVGDAGDQASGFYGRAGAAGQGQALLKAMGIDTNKKYPEFSLSGAGGEYSKAELLSLLMRFSNPGNQSVNGSDISLSDIMKRIQKG